MITHVVQAKGDGYWWDCRTATSLEEAQRLEQELLAKDDAWMSGTTKRETRIVPLNESNCYQRYLRKE